MIWADFRPLLTSYLVRISQGVAQTPGGIWLPDEARDRHWEGEILAAGPGIRIPYAKGERSEMWCLVGESVVFKREHLEVLDERERLGIVHDEELLAVAYPDRPSPCNDWVMIQPDAKQARVGLVAISEKYREAPTTGRVVGVGPGRLTLVGSLRGTRATVYKIVGTVLEVGDRVYWDAATEVVQIGREAVEYFLIKASDLVAWEVECADRQKDQERQADRHALSL